MERTLKDLVTEREELHKKLIETGVPESKIRWLVKLMTDYQDIQKDLENAQSSQFRDDAFMLNGEIKSNSKIPSIASFLRRFAEHIATQTLLLSNVQADHVEDLVDCIPCMSVDVPYHDE